MTETLRGTVSAYPAGDDQGLVEVRIAALEEGRDTVLARVEHTLGGVYWLPEIGDAVEVEMNDLPGCMPVVIRVCRPAQNTQIQACWTENNDRKQLCTRSGHTLTFDDTQDNTAIRLQTAGGLKLELNDATRCIRLSTQDQDQPFLVLDLKNGTLELSAPKQVCLQCGESSLKLEENGNVALTAKTDLAIKADNISLQATGNLDGKGQQMNLAGRSTAKLVGQNGIEFSSRGIAKFKVGVLEVK